MTNKNRKEPIRRVYNRKLMRSILKHQLHSNKIRQAWHSVHGHDISNKAKQKHNGILARIKRRLETKKLRRREK